MYILNILSSIFKTFVSISLQLIIVFRLLKKDLTCFWKV